MEKKYIKRTNPKDYLIEQFHSKMKYFLDAIALKNSAEELALSDMADELFINEVNKYVQPSNKDDMISGILSKLVRYILRFALVLE